VSDFLRHLVGRELGLETGLQPRVPSLFESDGRAPTLGATDVEREVGSAAPHSVALLPTLAHQNQARTATDTQVHQDAQPPRPAKPVELPAPVPPRPIPTPAASPRDEAAPSRSQATRERPLDAPVSIRPVSLIESVPLPPLRVRLAPAESPANADSAPVRKSDENEPPFRPNARPRPSDAVLPAVRPRAPSTQHAVRHIDAEATVVQVTIGRIEVRAAPAPTPQVRQREGPRPTALEDYLRERSGRKEA
jgi:hypothetical protein